MNNLLKLALEAHGGLRAWDRLQALETTVSVDGALWRQKQQNGLFDEAQVSIQLHHQEVLTRLANRGEIMRFTAHQMSLESSAGENTEVRNDPRDRFDEQTADSTWDRFDAAYFNSYALWGYLTAPFLYTYPGFETSEVESWEEGDETWRVLEVIFPESYAYHCKTQYAYFGEDGLLRRHVYSVDVLGGARGANYASDYRFVDGIMIPLQRRVYPIDMNNRKLSDPVLVSIDLKSPRFR